MKKYIPNHMSGLVLTLCAIMMTLTTSCDSDDTFETPTSDSRQEELVFSEAEKARIIEELHNKMVMQALCDVDTNTCPATYTPRLGKVLDIKSLCFEPLTDDPSFHPGRTASILVNNRKCGVIGIIHPEVADNFEAPEKARFLEFEETKARRGADHRYVRCRPKIDDAFVEQLHRV